MTDLLQPPHIPFNITWIQHEKNVYTDLPEVPVAIIVSLINFGVLCLGIVVNRAIYELLNRLSNRYINQIIYPCTVS